MIPVTEPTTPSSQGMKTLPKFAQWFVRLAVRKILSRFVYGYVCSKPLCVDTISNPFPLPCVELGKAGWTKYLAYSQLNAKNFSMPNELRQALTELDPSFAEGQ